MSFRSVEGWPGTSFSLAGSLFPAMNGLVKRKRQAPKNERRARRRPGRIIFVTGTDTGVGKTVFTGLLLHHLRVSGVHALAMKPFCSGGRADVRLLRAMQDRELSEDEINPFYFPEPVAPLVAARRHSTLVSLAEVLRHIKKISHRCECLLIEGSGGLFVPLGENFLVSDLIDRLDCETIVVARNRLGTINHTLLTINGLKDISKRNDAKRVNRASKVQIALIERAKPDISSATNLRILSELCAPIPVLEFGFLAKNANKSGVLKKKYKKVKKTLARFYG